MAPTYPRLNARKAVRWTHLWLGIIGGAFVCLMSVTGAIVTLRPQIAEWMSPASPQPAGCAGPVDWNRAEQQLRSYGHDEINRIYAFADGDPRYHVRIRTSRPAIYTHAIYDVCAGQVLGSIDLAWMDWTVDLHHNLLAGKAGRMWAGVIGIAFLISGLSGLTLWLLGRRRVSTAFRVQWEGSAARLSRDLHRAIGLGAACVLLLEAYTGLWLCFPQAMRATLGMVASVPEEARPARAPKPKAAAPQAGLAAMMASARQAIPDGVVREVRLPDGYGNVQVRMRRAGDFRSLGNNVVTVENAGATVVGIDRYADKSGALRFVQAMPGLHYGEWGGLGMRLLYAAAGLATVLLFASGLVIWLRPTARVRVKVRALASIES